MIGANGVDTMLAQFVSKAWVKVVKECDTYAGKDGFGKGMCSHKDNTSYSNLADNPGFMRCSILSCPHKDAAYILAKEMQSEELGRNDNLDVFNARTPHLRVVSSN